MSRRGMVLLMGLILCYASITSGQTGTVASSQIGTVASGTIAPGARTITVDGHGESKAKPDLMTVAFTVESKAPTGEECPQLQSKKINELISRPAIMP
ncbi:MAG TPA: SIMPL domain-containing protein [Candidatus Binataceae bacterium]|nr:SIMPL domain-containing protein [Candidatus Binataceae bacterium]